MNQHRKNYLILFSNTFPNGEGETFLCDELPFVSAQFSQVKIYPLFKAKHTTERELPDNVEIAEPLLKFEDKKRIELIKRGLLTIINPAKTFAPFLGTKELINRTLLGREIKVAEGQRKALILKRVRIFLTYLCIYRSIRGNKKLWKNLLRDCSLSDTIYFYWGDKSILIAPDLKAQLADLCNVVPKICARFHGSDLYEGAKGYLPWREEIYSSTDFAATTSNNATSYIKENYKNHPAEIRTCYLGTPPLLEKEKIQFPGNENNTESIAKTFRIVSCSNIIELKRVNLIFRSITTLLENKELFAKFENAGYGKIEWIHFGDGAEYFNIEREISLYFSKDPVSHFSILPKFIARNDQLKVTLMRQMPRSEILKYYISENNDLFILLSRSEGVPVSLMEALSCSIPIVATNVGGVKEIFNRGLEEKDHSPSQSIGYLLESSVTSGEVAETFLKYVLLSEEEKMQMRRNAFDCWKQNWNGVENYTTFAQLLTSVGQ